MGGGDKGLLRLSGKPLIEYVLERLAPQVNAIIINANRHQTRYGSYGYPVVADKLHDYQGPLAGMMSSMQEVETEYMVSAPCDSPFIPEELVSRLLDGLKIQKAQISVAHSGERMQPVFALMKTDLLDSMRHFLDDGQRKIDRWFAQHKLAVTDFSDKPLAFSNINHPHELAQMEAHLHA